MFPQLVGGRNQISIQISKIEAIVLLRDLLGWHVGA